MNRTTLRAISLLALSPALAACAAPLHQSAAAHPIAAPAATAQQQGAARKTGAIFRTEIDRVVGLVAQATQKEGAAAPYAATVTEAAQILCAMGHCHRFYVAADNPRIRATVAMLIKNRQSDGSFGPATDPDATQWVADALAAVDSERCADEIAAARAWLEKQHAVGRGWDDAVQRIAAQVRSDVFPEHLGKDAAGQAASLDPAHPDLGAAARLLVQLVACQAANRELDAGATPAVVAFDTVQQRALDYLMGKQKDGVFSATFGGQTFPDPAFTGFGLLAMQAKPKATRSAAEAQAIDQGIRWLLTQQNDDGSFGRQLQNYTTSVVVGALARCENPGAKPALAKAQKYILRCQNVEQSGYQSSDRDYGSIGYGGSQRGDLSNVHFALQALRESGLPAGDEAFQKALVFLQRSQNLKSVNDFSGKVSNPDDGGKLIDVTSGDDGGGMYYPGNSAAGYIVTPDGKSIPRSYGSMTYALLKSYTLCGVNADDPRMQAAIAWICDNWTVAENPGFDAPPGDKARFAGLFYYYMVMAQALDLAGVSTVKVKDAQSKDTQGGDNQVLWTKALHHQLQKMQQDDGSFVNKKNPRWMEGDDVLCTCYAMLALERCR